MQDPDIILYFLWDAHTLMILLIIFGSLWNEEELGQKSYFVWPDREELLGERLFIVPIRAEFGILWGPVDLN